MNLQIDSEISFAYPEEFLLTPYRLANQYSLRLGNLLITVSLIRDDFLWERRYRDTARLQELPPCDTIVNGMGIPGRRIWTEEFAKYGFQGRVRRFLSFNHRNKLSGKHLLFAVSRGANRVFVDARAETNFPENVLDGILESIAFPGEDAYAAACQHGPVHDTKASPYVVELKHFSRFGQEPKTTGTRISVAYASEDISDAQQQALKTFVKNEKMLFGKVKQAVFRHYTQSVYPLIEELTQRTEYSVIWEASNVQNAFQELAPHITHPQQVVSMIELASLLLHAQRPEGTVPIGLRFHCEWDEEHGLGVRVTGLELETVGTDAVAILPDLFEIDPQPGA